MAGALPQADFRIHRHVRLQFPAWILNLHLDPVDQLHALLPGLDLLGRELGLRIDEGDAPLVLLARVAVRVDGNGHSQANAAEVAFADVALHPRPVDVSDLHDGRSRGDDFARFGRFFEDDAIHGALQHPVTQLRRQHSVLRRRPLHLLRARRHFLLSPPQLDPPGLGQLQRRFRALHHGPLLFNLLLPRTRFDQCGGLERAFEQSAGRLEPGTELIPLLSADIVVAEQPLRPLPVGRRLLVLGPRLGRRRPRLLNLLSPLLPFCKSSNM